MTKERGVDVLINSLAGEALRSNMGRMSDASGPLYVSRLVRKTSCRSASLPMAKNVTFASVDLMPAFARRNAGLFVGDMLAWVLQLWVEEKISVQETARTLRRLAYRGGISD